MHKYWKISDFHKERQSGIGSSDIPILAGLSRKYGSTTYKLWQQKTGREESWSGNERTRVGKDLEAYTLARFVEEKFGQKISDKFYMSALHDRSCGIFKVKTEARHPERRYCLAHADLLVESYKEAGSYIGDGKYEALDTEPFIVEAKTVGLMASKRREGFIFSGYDITGNKTWQDIPDSVYLQIQWQLYTYNIKSAWVAALIDNQYHTFGPIAADPRVQEKCLALAERFWELVQADTPPAPETWDDVQALFPKQTDTTATIGGDDEMHVREMIKRDKDLAARIKTLDEERDEIKNAVGIFLGVNSVLSSANGDVLAKSSEQSRETVSLADIKKKAPEIEAMLREKQFVKSTTFRTVRY